MNAKSVKMNRCSPDHYYPLPPLSLYLPEKIQTGETKFFHYSDNRAAGCSGGAFLSPFFLPWRKRCANESENGFSSENDI